MYVVGDFTKYQIPMENYQLLNVIPFHFYWIIAPFAILGVSADYVIELELNHPFNNPVDCILSSLFQRP